MDTRLLRIFQAIAKHDGMAEAARHLHLTVSALSHGLKDLETELGTRLFDRVGRRLVINQAGEQLLAGVTEPLSRIEGAAAAVRALSQWGQGRLRIGASISACHHILPPVLRDLRHDYPRLLIEVRSGDSSPLVERLRRNEVDVVLGVEPEPAADLSIRGLFEDELLLVMAGAPATPAMPQPRAKEKRSTTRVLMPAAPLMARFWTVARMRSPMRERYIKTQTPAVSTRAGRWSWATCEQR